MSFMDIPDIVLALALFLFGARDIIVNNIDKDFSSSKNLIIRKFLAGKEKVIAKRLLRELGLSKEKATRIINDEHPHNHIGAIYFLSKCIVEAKNGSKYSFGLGNQHSSCYYVDSSGYTQDNYNCNVLSEIMKTLIDMVDRDYGYVFSFRDGNIPLAITFAERNNVLSIIAKDGNEIVNSGHTKEDCLINYEGFGNLIKEANENYKKIKGIAVTCNLSNGSNFLKAIKAYNDKIDKLAFNNIEKIEKVYILYRAIKDKDLDKEFAKAGLKCYRYFDLDETSKEYLYLIQNERKLLDDFPCYQCIKGKEKKCNAKYCYKELKG